MRIAEATRIRCTPVQPRPHSTTGRHFSRLVDSDKPRHWGYSCGLGPVSAGHTYRPQRLRWGLDASHSPTDCGNPASCVRRSAGSPFKVAAAPSGVRTNLFSSLEHVHTGWQGGGGVILPTERIPAENHINPAEFSAFLVITQSFYQAIFPVAVRGWKDLRHPPRHRPGVGHMRILLFHPL